MTEHDWAWGFALGGCGAALWPWGRGRRAVLAAVGLAVRAAVAAGLVLLGLAAGRPGWADNPLAGPVAAVATAAGWSAGGAAAALGGAATLAGLLTATAVDLARRLDPPPRRRVGDVPAAPPPPARPAVDRCRVADLRY